jgi:hypothetical protein
MKRFKNQGKSLNVPTEINQAYMLTRQTPATDIIDNNIWWKGPTNDVASKIQQKTNIMTKVGASDNKIWEIIH